MQVYVNVYDLPDQTQVNDRFRSLGLGFYHSGIQIENKEYSFGTGGIQRTAPQLPDFGRLREQISLGQFFGTQTDLNQVINDLTNNGGFGIGSYNIAHRNCNHFSDAFSKALLGESTTLPEYINRAASIGQSFVSNTPSGGSGSQAESTSFPMLGQVSAPTLNSGGSKHTSKSSKTYASGFQKDPEADKGSIFSYFFGSNFPFSSTTSSAASSSTGKDNSSSITSTSTKSDDMDAKKGGMFSSFGSQKSAGKGKKELTEKQKAALEKMKGNK
jgi:deubiquitinase DESI2